LLARIKTTKFKLRYFGHIMRHTEKDIIQGTYLITKEAKGETNDNMFRQHIIQWTDTTEVSGEGRSMVRSTLGSKMTESSHIAVPYVWRGMTYGNVYVLYSH